MGSWEVVKGFSNPVLGETLGFLELFQRYFKGKKNQIRVVFFQFTDKMKG